MSHTKRSKAVSALFILFVAALTLATLTACNDTTAPLSTCTSDSTYWIKWYRPDGVTLVDSSKMSVSVTWPCKR